MTKKIFILIAMYLMLNSTSVFSQAVFTWGKAYKKNAATTAGEKYDITLRGAKAENVKLFLEKSLVFVYAYLPDKKAHDVNPKITGDILQKRIVDAEGDSALKAILEKDITNMDLIQWLGTLNDNDSIVFKPYLGEAVKNTETLVVIFKSGTPDLKDEKSDITDCYQPTLTDQLIRESLGSMEKKFQNLIGVGSNNNRIRWDCTIDHKRICADSAEESKMKKGSSIKHNHLDNDCHEEKNAELEEQLNHGIIYYDFEKKYFFKQTVSGRKLFNFNSWDFAFNRNRQIKVLNINRYLYEVSIESLALEYDSEMPVLFRNLFVGDSATTLGTLLNIFKNNIGGTGGPKMESGEIKGTIVKSTCINKIEFKYNLLQEALVYYNSMSNYLKRRKLEAFALCSKFPCCCRENNDDFGMMYEVMLNTLQHINVLSSDLQIMLKLEQAKSGSHKDLPAFIQQLQTSLPSEANLTKLFLFVQNIRKTNGEYITPPIKITGNRFELLMKFKAWDATTDKSGDTDRLYASQWNSGPKDEIYIDVPVLFSPFVSFSSGSFVGLNRNLQEITYEWQKIPSTGNVITDSARYNLVQTGYSRLPIGFCALVNLQSKVLSMVGLGISGGVGLTIESKPRIAYLAGGSLFLGDLKQVVLTAGFAGMQVDRLNHDLKAYADQGVIAYERTRPEIKYYNEFKVGGFISLSYTPFKVNKRPVYNESLSAHAEEAKQKTGTAQNTNNNTPVTGSTGDAPKK